MARIDLHAVALAAYGRKRARRSAATAGMAGRMARRALAGGRRQLARLPCDDRFFVRALAIARRIASSFLGIGFGLGFPKRIRSIASMLERTNDAILDGAYGHARELAQVVSDFHRDHQLNWIDDLCDTIDDVAQTRFYKGAAKVTRGFVHADTDVIADELDVLAELADASVAA